MKKNKPAVPEPNPGAAASGKFSLMLLNESEQGGILGREKKSL